MRQPERVRVRMPKPRITVHRGHARVTMGKPRVTVRLRSSGRRKASRRQRSPESRKTQRPRKRRGSRNIVDFMASGF